MIVLFGFAGSGKSTQGKKIANLFGWKWLSVGEIIRKTGKYVEATKTGQLIPDEDVIKLMDEQIEKIEHEGGDAILDGYPRDEFQAKYIVDNMAKKINAAIILDVSKDELLKRLTLRGREDDMDKDSIERRFKVFEDNVNAITTLFKNNSIPVKYIDGEGAVEEVTDRLVNLIKRLNSEKM